MKNNAGIMVQAYMPNELSKIYKISHINEIHRFFLSKHFEKKKDITNKKLKIYFQSRVTKKSGNYDKKTYLYLTQPRLKMCQM